MSFSKAKLIRFNDVVPSTPPPANHNLSKDKAREKIKSTAGSIGPQSPTHSEAGSIQSVPGNFKTPNLPKKTKTAISATKLKPKDLFNNDLEALKEKTEECENKTKYIHKLSEELDQHIKNLDSLKLEKEQLQREHQNELQELEFDMLKMMTKLQKQEEETALKMKEIQEKFEAHTDALMKTNEYNMGQLILDYEIKIRDTRQSSEQILKIRLDEAESLWKKKLQDKESESEAILQECQEISEYSIIQCELEKKKTQQCLHETKLAYNKLERKYEDLVSTQKTLDKNWTDTERELELKINNLSKIIESQEGDVKKLNVEIKAYQLTISNSQTTIEVLKKRLINSDRDVEQLKQEITRCEEKLIDYENKYFQLNGELKEANELNEDLELQYEASIQLNKDTINEMRDQLLAKVSYYESQVQAYSKQVKEEEELKEELLQQLSENIEIVNKINLGVEKVEECYSIKIKDLEKIIGSYKIKEASCASKMDALNKENEAFTAKLKQQENTIEELKQNFHQLEAKNTDLKDKYEYYKTKSEEFEAEAKESSLTRKKYIDISGKYDSLLQDFEVLQLENQNNKSKIVDMSNKLEGLLKMVEGYEQLLKEKETLEIENLSYKNKFEEQKLKKYKFAAKDKENIGSPNRSVLESPNRGSPFKEIN